MQVKYLIWRTAVALGISAVAGVLFVGSFVYTAWGWACLLFALALDEVLGPGLWWGPIVWLAGIGFVWQLITFAVSSEARWIFLPRSS